MLGACSLGGASHLKALVPFLDQARRDGDETLVVGPPSLAAMAEQTGHRFLEGGEPGEDEIAPIREQLPVLPAKQASVLGNRQLFGRMATTAMLEGMERALVDWQPDVVLREPCEYASAVVAARLEIPTVQVAIGLARVEWGSIEAAAPALEAHLDGLVDLLRNSPYLTRFAASLDPSPFPDTRRFREAPEKERGESMGWWADSDAPLVYVTFGTVLGYMSIAWEVYQTAIDAVAGLEARVLMTVGHRFDPSRLEGVPANVRVEAWVDQSVVLTEAAVVVCHGGSGTTFGALAAGVPLVVVPIFADQFANGQKILQAGDGLVVDTTKTPGAASPLVRTDAARIRQSITSLLTTETYFDAARTVAGEMASEPSIATVLDGIRAAL